MLLLVTGGSACGKSEYAESLALDLHEGQEGRLIYLATMEPYGAAAEERIARHRTLRAGKGFETIERYRDLAGLKDLPEGAVILLECMSNLTANELYDETGTVRDGAEERILEGMARLEAAAAHLVVVTLNVFEDGRTFDEGTERFRQCLARVNAELARQADAVTEVICGIPVFVKGPLLKEGGSPCSH